MDVVTSRGQVICGAEGAPGNRCVIPASGVYYLLVPRGELADTFGRFRVTGARVS